MSADTRWTERATPWLFAALFFFLPIHIAPVYQLTLVLLLVTLLGGNWNRLWQRVRGEPLFWIFQAFFWMFVLSLLWTQDMAEGWHMVRRYGLFLLSGLYLNELLMRLLARDDAHSLLFDHYAAVVRVLATEHGEVLEPLLRSFELLLLREVGLLPALDVQTLTLAPLEPQGRYALVAEAGLRAVPAAERASLSGAQWLQLHAALRDGVPFTTLLRECAAVAGELKPQLRGLLQYHCGHPVLRTRQFMMDLQSL